MDKPDRVFGRGVEWGRLAAFATRTGEATAGGAALGLVTGRRRQGKSFLVQAFVEAAGGMYFAATEATEAESLRHFTEALVRHTGDLTGATFRDWNDAIAYLFRSFGGRPTVVAIDNFPALSTVSPTLPSILRRELGPDASGGTSSARLILCGSAMKATKNVLDGRSELGLVVEPFPHREAAEFRGMNDPQLAVLVHAVVGGAPAYRPSALADFDAWVIRTVLNPRTTLCGEARYLLAEEPFVRDSPCCHSALAAIATGHHSYGGIAGFTGCGSERMAASLKALEECSLIARQPDLFLPGSERYRIVEPLITFYEAIMRTRWAELESHRADQVWRTSRQRFLARVARPHFKALCRAFARESGDTIFAGRPGEVGFGTVADPASRARLEIDVVALAANTPRRVLALGKAEWDEVIGHRHLQDLAVARDLLRSRGYDTDAVVLVLYGAAGFTAGLSVAAAGDERIVLVGLDRLYS